MLVILPAEVTSDSEVFSGEAASTYHPATSVTEFLGLASLIRRLHLADWGTVGVARNRHWGGL
ncbi:hypothetical protein A9K55_004488 [Cordyceps militaris]|uniref:Uncharacterized protein n=1 Tax=Cordyceps militaris TaxID=73501 RepID=A0A2H4SQC4_CORMI|nr:hypothetical protein A9K55_004488 [Cordyceps militaris]